MYLDGFEKFRDGVDCLRRQLAAAQAWAKELEALTQDFLDWANEATAYKTRMHLESDARRLLGKGQQNEPA